MTSCRIVRLILAAAVSAVAAPSSARAQADAGPDDAGPVSDAADGDAGADAGPADAAPGDGPTVAFVNPGDGDEVSGQVTIEVEASDDDGVARVEFQLDGMPRGSDAEPPYQHLWQTANYAGTSHTLTAVAYDTLDNPTEASVTVTVAEEPAATPTPASGGAARNSTIRSRVDPISWGCSAQGWRRLRTGGSTRAGADPGSADQSARWGARSFAEAPARRRCATTRRRVNAALQPAASVVTRQGRRK